MADIGDIAPAMLLCSWHARRTFGRNLLTCVKSTEDREELLAHIRVILSALDKQKCFKLPKFLVVLKTKKKSRNGQKENQ